jgi:uncharacterized protein (TIGR02466 family)
MTFNISNFSVFPLFPTTIGAIVADKDLSKLNQIKKLKYNELESPGSTNCFISEDQQIFSNFQKEKNIVMSYFNKFKNDVLKYETTEFEVTTSWSTKMLTNSVSHFHAHRNSYYSGIIYLETVDRGGEIEFENVGIAPSSFMLNKPTEFNIFNFETFYFTPQKNLIVFFPSYLRHRVKPYLGNDPRYSIAFNIIPIGQYGSKDSSVNILLNTDTDPKVGNNNH